MRLVGPRLAGPNGESGFTLLEVLFAMAIMGVGVLTIALAQVTAMKVSSKSKNLSQAMYLAKEQMDTFAAMTGSSAIFQVDSANNMDPLNPISVTNNALDNTTYTRSFDVTANTPAPGMATILVRVQWDTPNARTRTSQLRFVKSLAN